MRRLGVVLTSAWVVAGVAGGLCAGWGVASARDGEPVTAKQCRHQWADLSQLHGENGNPRGPVHALTKRWNATDATADRLADEATADDCGPRIDDFAAAWGALESFQYDLDAFDPAADLARAEGDRRHYENLHSPGEPDNELSPKLKRAFRVIRHQTPAAIEDLEPALDGAKGVDVQDRAQVKAFLTHAREIKQDSTHVQKMQHPYRVIGNAELDEE